jgi:hypothetical protein
MQIRIGEAASSCVRESEPSFSIELGEFLPQVMAFYEKLLYVELFNYAVMLSFSLCIFSLEM